VEDVLPLGVANLFFPSALLLCGVALSVALLAQEVVNQRRRNCTLGSNHYGTETRTRHGTE